MTPRYIRGVPRLPLLARVLVSGALASALAPSPAQGQVVVLDEGIFTLVVGGQRVGREDFSIRRTLADGNVTAQGNVLRAEGRSTVVLTTDATGTPLRFQVDRSVAGRTVESVSGEFRRGGLWSGRAVRPGMESGREFRLPEPVGVADDAVVHHAWFLVQFPHDAPVPVLDPRTFALRTPLLERAGADTVLLGLDRIPAVRWTVRDHADGPVRREVWTDPQGRLLKVFVPAEDLVATRDDPPPETPPPAPAYEAPDPLPNRTWN